MISVDEAEARIRAAVAPLPMEWVPLEAAFGRTLARDLRALRDQPAGAISAMDGYAVRARDLADGGSVRIAAAIAAGSPAPAPLAPGTAARIYTGGLVPDGADAILIQENAVVDDDRLRTADPPTPGQFVRARGLDFATGEVLLRAGAELTARRVGLAATMGHGHLPVHRRPRVGIAATGDELRRPGTALATHEIPNSNALTIAGIVRAFGGEAIDLGIVTDDRAALTDLAARAAGLDLLVTSGGASVGAHDLVAAALGEAGLALDFWKIAMRPGKPLLFGRLGAVPVLGLPGNPVSTAVCSLIFLRAAIDRLAGRPDRPLPSLSCRLATPLAANDARQDYVRATWAADPAGGPALVTPATRQDSSMLATLAASDVLVIRPPHDPAKPAGAAVDVIPLERLTGV